MSLELMAVVLGLAAVDALNPFSIAAQAYLLGTAQPYKRAWTFAVGSFAVYLAGGVLFVQGAGAFLRSLLPELPRLVLPVGAIALGIGCVALAAHLWFKSNRGKPFVPPADLSVSATLGFAIFSTLSDLPTALPYFAAAAKIAETSDTFLTQVAWLLVYNLVFIAPLVMLIWVHIALGVRSASVFGSIERSVNWSFVFLLPPLLALGGLWLVYWGSVPLLSHLGPL